MTLNSNTLEVTHRARQEGTPERNDLEALVGKLPEEPSESMIIESLINIGTQHVSQASADIGYAQLTLTISDAERASRKKVNQEQRTKYAKRMSYTDE